MSAFASSFTKTFAELNNAKAFFERQQRRKTLDIGVIAPKNPKGKFFFDKISPGVRSYVHILYDACLVHGFDIVLMMASLAEQKHCVIHTEAPHKPKKLYICDFRQTKSMISPETLEDELKLFQFVDTLVNSSELLNHSYVSTHKPIKAKCHCGSNAQLNELRKQFANGNELAMGSFTATIMWFMETKFMNKALNLHTAGLVTNDVNNSTRVLRKLPITPTNTPRIDHSTPPPAAEEPQMVQLLNENGEIADDWEDIEL